MKLVFDVIIWFIVGLVVGFLDLFRGLHEPGH